MTRPLRIEFPGALWHVTSRGVEKRNVFIDHQDRRAFISRLGRTVEKCHWELHAYVLMANHYHLLLTTPEMTLSKGMQWLGGSYAQYFNERYGRWGHLFGGRFKAHLVDTDAYLVTAARYIVLNPVRAGITATADEWPWSSYLATAGLKWTPRWLSVAAILDRFHLTDREIARRYYREYVCAQPDPTTNGVAAGVRPLYRT